MKMRKIKTVIILVCILGKGISSVYAQERTLPTGKWVLDSIAAFEDEVQITPFNFDSLTFSPPLSMDIRQDSVFFVYQNYTNNARLNDVLNEYRLCMPTCAQWKIRGRNLQLTWQQDVKEPENKLFTIILIFKQR